MRISNVTAIRNVSVVKTELKRDGNLKKGVLTEVPHEILKEAEKAGITTQQQESSGLLFHLDTNTIFSKINELYKGQIELLDTKEAFQKYDWLNEYRWNREDLGWHRCQGRALFQIRRARICHCLESSWPLCGDALWRDYRDLRHGDRKRGSVDRSASRANRTSNVDSRWKSTGGSCGEQYFALGHSWLASDCQVQRTLADQG